MRKTQQDAVLEYLQKYGKITSNDAIYELHITRLADVIYKLKRKGYKIESIKELVDTDYGKTEIAVYRMER